MRAVGAVVLVLSALVVAPTARADASGTVSGQVVDASGAPLANICVYADTVPYPGGGYSGPVTDANGDYTFSLPPGTYLVSFEGCESNYVTQFYPGQPSWQTAGQVTVAAGQTTGGVDAHMEVGGMITGKVLDQGTGAPPPQFDIEAEAEPLGPPSFPDNPEPVARATLNTDGTYTLTGLAPGSYVVDFGVETVNGSASPYADAWYPDAPDPGHGTIVNVQSGQTVSLGVELAEAPGTVTGRVVDLAGTPLAGYLVRAYIIQPDGSQFPFFDFATTGPDGTFTLTDLAPGLWTVAVQPNGGEVISSQPVTVQIGGTTPNIDFAFCFGTECPPTRLLAWTTRIKNHELLFAGRTSDPGDGLLNVVLSGRLGRRTVHIRKIDYQVTNGSFDYSMPLPRRDRGLRSGVLTLVFAATQATLGGRFLVRVPSVYPRPAAKPARPHKHKRERKHKDLGRVATVIHRALGPVPSEP